MIVRGLDIDDAANNLACHMGIESFKASDGWLLLLSDHHGRGNKVERGESGSADIKNMKKRRKKARFLSAIPQKSS